MPTLSDKSKKILETCHEDIQRLCYEAIKYFDFTVLEGHRGEDAQNAAYAKGLSKVRWPNGKHNSNPSLAVDLAPYPIDWKAGEKMNQRFVLLAGFMLCLAAQKGIKLRWGGDWNMNMDTRDEGFRDLPHFELKDD